MKKFMDEDFLLNSPSAVRLYHEYAASMPIFDYHCHLSPKQISENWREPDITQAWLAGDHYKWRMIRANGMDERDGNSFEKFLNWSDTIAHSIGNPLYHWTHLELQRYFGITEPLCPASARRIYDECNRALRDDPDLNVFGIFRKFNVYAVGTTDDPVDSLEFHRAVKGKTPAKVIPSFRPDKAINIDSPAFAGYIDKLSEVSGVSISRASDVIDALSLRLDHFVANGCLATDMALCYPPFETASEAEIDKILNKALSGKPVSPLEAEQYRTFVVLALGREYAKRNLVMQIHLQASRNNNSRQFAALGPDSGYDAVSDFQIAAKLQKLLDNLESADSLPKMILYSVNPNDYYVLGSLIGCFQKDVPGKLQLGSGWWFCDHIDGMTEQLRTLGDLGMLSRFVGMLTDSRSFLSYPRHEYFRRILCNLLGTWMDNGEIPGDFGLVGGMVKDISFANARCFFEN
ncbi:MAG: glucuronate isomerase [Sphaerochaetaceae bacterium]|nr:glucuronate isomerase [Sphaerochaetaceae bacterium]MDD4006907.1 glucuronate isomerase [Sphaerochaetaceae bacterium]MDD4396130.1 glucuronate isomerase [Sphaerochaetaceae bacterium]